MTTSSAATAAAVTARSLYRSILRAHARHLPNEMRSLGDAYVKSEWRLHRTVTDEKTLNHFFKEWGDYLSHIQQTARARESRAAVGSMDVVVEKNHTKNAPDDDGDMNSTNPNSKLYSFGSDLGKDVQMNLTEEQLAQLHKLKEEAFKAK